MFHNLQLWFWFSFDQSLDFTKLFIKLIKLYIRFYDRNHILLIHNPRFLTSQPLNQTYMWSVPHKKSPTFVFKDSNFNNSLLLTTHQHTKLAQPKQKQEKPTTYPISFHALTPVPHSNFQHKWQEQSSNITICFPSFILYHNTTLFSKVQMPSHRIISDN